MAPFNLENGSKCEVADGAAVIVVSEGLPSVISFLTRWMEVDLLEVQVVQQSSWRVE